MTAPLPCAVVIFGASGFIGRNIVDRLSGRIARIIGVTHVSPAVPGCSEVVRFSALDSVGELPQDTVAIHVAAHRYDASNFTLEQSEILRNNARMVEEVYHFCAQRRIGEVRLASSMAVYGADLLVLDDAIPIDMNSRPHPNETMYAWSKRWSEVLSDLYFEKFGIHTIAFRLSNPYGPYDSLDLTKAHVAAAFVIKALNADTEFEIRGNASVSRDFIFSGDVAAIFEQSLRVRSVHDRFNLCSGRSTTLLELAQAALLAAGVTKPIKSGVSVGTGPLTRPSIAKRLQSAFPLELRQLSDGLAETVDWYRRVL